MDLVLLLLHLEGRLHLADKVSPPKELHPALATVFDVSKGINVSILVHALKQIRRAALLAPKCTKVSLLVHTNCSFHCGFVGEGKELLKQSILL